MPQSSGSPATSPPPIVAKAPIGNACPIGDGVGQPLPLLSAFLAEAGLERSRGVGPRVLFAGTHPEQWVALARPGADLPVRLPLVRLGGVGLALDAPRDGTGVFRQHGFSRHRSLS